MDKDKDKDIPKVLQNEVQYQDLFFYQKSEVLYALTYHFAKRFLSAKADRTVDQMIQAARSGKQNIVEGSADGVTSMEMELRLLNVARASIQELLEDYEDYIISHRLLKWKQGHPRFDGLLAFCRNHNKLYDYEPYFDSWTSEEMCNIGITLCRMVDKMMMTYQKKKESEFIKEGGIKERMAAARLNYRNNQGQALEAANYEITALQRENTELRKTIVQLQKEIALLRK